MKRLKSERHLYRTSLHCCLTAHNLQMIYNHYRPSNQTWLYHQNKRKTGSCTQTTVIPCLTLQNWRKSNVVKILWFKVKVNNFKLQLQLWCHNLEPIEAHIIGQSHGHSLKDALWWTTTYYHLSIINRQTYFPITTTMTDCDWPIKSQIQTTSLASKMFEM